MAESKVIESGPVSTGRVSLHPFFAVCAVLLGSLLANVDSRLFSVGLPDLRGALSLSFDEGAWLATAGTASQIFVAPAVAWMATVFGLRRVLGVPALVYAAISLMIPLVRDYNLLLVLNILHGLLLGTFVPATLLIIFRNLPMKWWLPAIAIYAIRVGFTLNFGVALTGFYVDHLGWQWIYWQDAIIAPLMALFVYLGTPREPIDRFVLCEADWGGMLLFGTGMAMIYAGLDQGNRLDWLGSGTVVALLGGGAVLVIGFFINESHREAAMGPCGNIVVAQYRPRAGGDPALHHDRPVELLVGAEFPDQHRATATRAIRIAVSHLCRCTDDRAAATVDLAGSPLST